MLLNTTSALHNRDVIIMSNGMEKEIPMIIYKI